MAGLAESIERDLAERIRGRRALPSRLTLGALAEAYGVSATPVRTAIDGLVRKRLLRRDGAGRLAVRGGEPPAPSTTEAPAGVARDLDGEIAEELILTSLTEGGSFVREEALAERHGVGRTALRGALQRIAGGGLVEHVPRRGWRVPHFDEAEMDAYIDVRETLELKALELARPRLERADLERMETGNRPAAVRAGRIDNDLHAYFIERSNNRYVRAFFDTNGRYFNALFDYAGLGTRVLADMAAQHRAILDAALHRRWAQAREALSEHIHAQKPVMERFLDQLHREPR